MYSPCSCTSPMHKLGGPSPPTLHNYWRNFYLKTSMQKSSVVPTSSATAWAYFQRPPQTPACKGDCRKCYLKGWDGAICAHLSHSAHAIEPLAGRPRMPSLPGSRIARHMTLLYHVWEASARENEPQRDAKMQASGLEPYCINNCCFNLGRPTQMMPTHANWFCCSHCGTQSKTRFPAFFIFSKFICYLGGMLSHLHCSRSINYRFNRRK
jgi:hypothetical protein